MNLRRFSTVFCLLGCLAVASPAQPKGDPAEWVPSDALFYVGVTDTAKLWKDLQNTAGYKLMNLDELKKSNPLSSFLDEFRSRLAAAVDLAPAQLESPFAGPAAFYVRPGASRKSEDVYPTLLVGIGNADLMKKYYNAATRKMRDAARSHESISAGSYQIDVFKGGDENTASDPSDDDPDDLPSELQAGDFEGAARKMMDEFFSPDTLPESLAMTLAGDRFVVSRDADAVKAALKSLDKSESIAGADEHRALLKHFEPAGSMRLLVRLTQIIEMESADESPEEREKMNTILGLKCINAFIGHAGIGAADYDLKAEGMLLTRGEPTGVVKILSMKNAPISAPDSVPADAAVMLSLNTEIAALIDEIEKLIRQTDPDQADQMRAGMESVPTADGGTLNLRKDFFEQLKAPFILSMGFGKPYGAADSFKFLASIGHRSRQAMDKFLAAVAQPPMLAPRELRGTQVYDMPMVGVTLAPSADRLFAGITPSVESALQGAADGLASDPGFKRAAKLAPPEAWLTLFVDQKKMTEGAIGIYENRENIEAAGMSGMIAMQIAQSFAGQGAVSPDVLRKAVKYYAPSIMTAATSPDGIRFTLVQLKPDDAH